MAKELTTEECMEIFKKYDPERYDYYQKNAWYFGCDARNYARYLKELHAPSDDVYVVCFDSAGYIGAVTSIDKEYAENAARQLRTVGRKVRCMNREKFLELQAQEEKERQKNQKGMMEAGLCQS